MRTFLQSRAGTEFFSGAPFTFVIHKDYWEYVFKLQHGYCVINAILSNEHLVTLFASWGDYFKPMSFPEIDRHFPKVNSHFPAKVDIFLER